MKEFNLWALDENHNIVAILNPVNVQWNRKFKGVGSFSIQILARDYDSSFKYIYTPDRPEMGVITQRNLRQETGYYSIYLSGLFMEKELSRMVVYPRQAQIKEPYVDDDGRVLYRTFSNGNINSAPNWNSQTGLAENVALAYFNGFKHMSTTDGIDFTLDVESPTSQNRGKEITYTRRAESLADALSNILAPSRMGYRVVYDFENDKKSLEIYQTYDRTSDGDNNQVVFSTTWGNIRNLDIVESTTESSTGAVVYGAYQNAYWYDFAARSVGDIIVLQQMPYNYNGNYATAVLGEGEPSFQLVEGKEPSYDFEVRELQMIIREGDENNHFGTMPFRVSDNASYGGYINSAKAQGREKLRVTAEIRDISFDTTVGHYEYMVDFDLGDKVSVEIPEIGMSEDFLISECYEVMKDGQWSLELELTKEEI